MKTLSLFILLLISGAIGWRISFAFRDPQIQQVDCNKGYGEAEICTAIYLKDIRDMLRQRKEGE